MTGNNQSSTSRSLYLSPRQEKSNRAGGQTNDSLICFLMYKSEWERRQKKELSEEWERRKSLSGAYVRTNVFIHHSMPQMNSFYHELLLVRKKYFTQWVHFLAPSDFWEKHVSWNRIWMHNFDFMEGELKF